MGCAWCFERVCAGVIVLLFLSQESASIRTLESGEEVMATAPEASVPSSMLQADEEVNRKFQAYQEFYNNHQGVPKKTVDEFGAILLQQRADSNTTCAGFMEHCTPFGFGCCGQGFTISCQCYNPVVMAVHGKYGCVCTD